MAVPRQSKANAPHPAPVRFDRHSLLEVWWITDFPKGACPTSDRRNHEGISYLTSLRFPVRDFAKCESIDGNIIKNDEAMIDRRTFRAGNGMLAQSGTRFSPCCQQPKLVRTESLPSQSSFRVPFSDLIPHRKPLVMVRLESTLQRIRIHFQGNRIVAAAIQESLHVKLAEARYAESPILLHVHELVKQETVERFMGNHDITECDCSHSRLVREVLNPQAFER